MKPFGSKPGTDLYGIGLIDVYDTKAANQSFHDLFTYLNKSKKLHPDGYYLRDNTPYTISNGSDL